MDITVVASSLIGLMFLHQRDEFFGGPALGLEIIIVGSRGTGVHHEVNGRSATKDVSDGDDGTATGKPLRWSGVVERSSLAVEFHVTGVDARAEDPWVVQVALSGFDEHNLEVMVKVGQTACHDTSA